MCICAATSYRPKKIHPSFFRVPAPKGSAGAAKAHTAGQGVNRLDIFRLADVTDWKFCYLQANSFARRAQSHQRQDHPVIIQLVPL